MKGNLNVVLAKFQVKSNSVYIESTLLKDVNVEFWHITPLDNSHVLMLFIFFSSKNLMAYLLCFDITLLKRDKALFEDWIQVTATLLSPTDRWLL